MLAVALGQLALPAPPVIAASFTPKAVIIVGPSGSSTSRFRESGEVMAQEAEAAGMAVTRIYHPKATWERVLKSIQGANFVVYMGHGNGWPSPYAPFQERTKNGFGLNPYEGSSASQHTYYGANYIRKEVTLAKDAIVALVHLCYASGNGEPGMAIPSWDVARQRVDNYAAGFLAAGARTVFSLGWRPRFNMPKSLMRSDKSMDAIFQTPTDGSPSGWIGWNPKYFSSERMAGARLHLDPHKSYGFYRAVTGDLKFTAAEWRGAPSSGEGGDTGATTGAPEITELAVAGMGEVGTASASLPSFTPNGDGLADKLVVQHTVSKAAYLDVKVTNSAGTRVRKFTVWSAKGTSTSSWNGKNGSGNVVPDGTYTLTYRPRDTAGNVGQARAISVLVLTAARVLAPSRSAIYAVNYDGLADTTDLTIKLSRQATITWRILNGAGDAVRTPRDGVKLAAGTYTFTWNGKDANRKYVPDGTYRSVVRVKTSLGVYVAERTVHVGAFRITSSVASPKRGTKVTFTIRNSEPLKSAPKLDITQPGLATYTVSTTKVSAYKYKVTVTLKSGGSAGNLEVTARGTNKADSKVRTTIILPLR
jgi:flagellar hook assembly protein FlgD